ncbi:MAG: AarF/ABC1/UbiB kinase family protein [Nocardioidaceae bacterium]|nr:AarF/ABC1/UbiB kinase family protein [Nocardioidaceae bacterium]
MNTDTSGAQQDPPATPRPERPAIPRRAVARTARMASLPLGFAGRATLGLGRRLAGANADAVSRDVQQRTAEQVFKVLGELKGGAMKFGQALSVFESALPDELAAPYRAALTQLQDAAPPMDSGTVHRVIAAELGPRWREQLVELEPDPAAAASIGQVHRGRWHDGRRVAVKVQYPGAGEALSSDLRQIARVARMVGPLAPGIEVMPLVDELRARIEEELDYRLEAQAQAVFAASYAADPDVEVPAVVAHTSKLLVTTWMDSTGSLARLIAEGSQADRDHFGELYVRFLFSGPVRTGLLHADPHPGNFRMLPDRRLGVVDYGAVARLPEHGLPKPIGRLLRRAVEDDYDAVLQGLRDEGFIRRGVDLDPGVLRDFLGPFVEPAQSETFRFSREWMRGQANRLYDPNDALPVSLKINLPPSYLLIHRVWIGGIGVLSQLGAQASFRAICAESLPGFADG